MVASPPPAESPQQRSAHLLDIIADMTGVGAWELDVDSLSPLWSSQARQIFDLDPAATLRLAREASGLGSQRLLLEIAGELGGITRNAVIGKVHRLGVSGRAKSPSSSVPAPRLPRR